MLVGRDLVRVREQLVGHRGRETLGLRLGREPRLELADLAVLAEGILDTTTAYDAALATHARGKRARPFIVCDGSPCEWKRV